MVFELGSKWPIRVVFLQTLKYEVLSISRYGSPAEMLEVYVLVEYLLVDLLDSIGPKGLYCTHQNVGQNP
jgi:hypothetical protein